MDSAPICAKLLHRCLGRTIDVVDTYRRLDRFKNGESRPAGYRSCRRHVEEALNSLPYRKQKKISETYPGHWIGRSGVIFWPLKSPDITLDYYAWSRLKGKVYKRKVETSRSHFTCFAQVKECLNQLRSATQQLSTRAAKCIEVDAVLADETTDISNATQLVVIYRYITNGKPVEGFWACKNSPEQNAESLFMCTEEEIDRHVREDPSKLIAQTYDGCAKDTEKNFRRCTDGQYVENQIQQGAVQPDYLILTAQRHERGEVIGGVERLLE
ncbi:hypothetical protein ANN_14569 [Periplaneta americana]|uniref:Uncharacterized protein n=1 Tax=Periplaneta americana TaxID=6978 RepID=A0ABQ8SY54_PERAM|nr:hypothetical protein ANN_14569 [Periplaneta americana]